MKIINQTRYRTDHLRAFVRRIAEDELSPKKRKVAEITFVRAANSGGWSSGHASLGGRRMKVRIPASAKKIDLAMVIAHEMAHLRGMNHKQMRGNHHYHRLPATNELYAWAEELPLEISVPKDKAKPDMQKVRYERVLVSIKNWQSKLKRAQTALRKLRDKERYYVKEFERKAAINAQHTEQEGK
jgi:signal recognition particle subunit SEC65